MRNNRDITRGEIAERLSIPYSTVRDALEAFAESGVAAKRIEMVGRVRRVFYRFLATVVPPPPRPRYYRTMYVRMYYTETPRQKTPMPIAEFRVTVVSRYFNSWRPANLERVPNHIGLALAPQTYWAALNSEEWWEDNEEIDIDELATSVPTFKSLDFAERLAIFYTSRKDPTNFISLEKPDWLEVEDVEQALEMLRERTGDYVYQECVIKVQERIRANEGRLHNKFDNTTGRIEIPASFPTPREDDCPQMRLYKETGFITKGETIHR